MNHVDHNNLYHSPFFSLFDKIIEIKTKTVTITPKINIDVVKS